jgi:tRNA (cmo5U34)-methyltransferase
MMEPRSANAVGALFERFASTYDATRRVLVPAFDSFYGTAIEVLTLRDLPSATPRILDIGAGTGLLSGLVAGAVPNARLVLLDASSAMVDQARDRLGSAWERCETVVADAADELPEGRFDAVVSALAIHHLTDTDKADLYKRVHERLLPGGVFVNADQVAGPTPALDAAYAQRWRVHTSALGATDDDLREADLRMAMDLPTSVNAQCQWLRDAGFVDVDCFFKSWRFAVFGGWRSH